MLHPGLRGCPRAGKAAEDPLPGQQLAKFSFPCSARSGYEPSLRPCAPLASHCVRKALSMQARRDFKMELRFLCAECHS